MTGTRSHRQAVLLLLLLLTSSTLATAAHAQIGRIRDAAGRLGNQANPARLLEGEPPITTSLGDARFAVDSLDNFVPVNRLDDARAGRLPVDSLDNFSIRSLLELQRTPNGGFLLQPGIWEMHTQSYCLKAGTYGPGGGDGYLFAPPEGPAEEAVVAIVRNSVNKPGIPQQKIQQLLWAIIARTKFEDLNPELKAVAGQLLSPQQMAMLNRNALDLLPGPSLQQALARLPGPVRQVLEAEAQLRQMLTSTTATFEDMERVAVLAGAAPQGPDSRAVPYGRWSRHPDGYYVRYLPLGYSHTVTQLWVQRGSPAVGKEYDPALHIAVPGNTARQRLIQSGRTYGTTD